MAPVGDVPKSVRERLALHRTQPSCNQCHGVIDPLGQALENFNAVGEWRARERDSGVLVDSTGTTSTGLPVNSPEELRAALLERPDAVRARADREAADVRARAAASSITTCPSCAASWRTLQREGYSFESIVLGVAQSVPFRMRSAAEEPAGG